MGREVKRVPLNFNWPIGKIWVGYMIDTCPKEVYKLRCEECRLFAKIKNIKLKHNCPDYEILEVPKGDGWQMWETVSEGSPISPVFETPEKLAKWLYETNATSSGHQTSTYDQWLGMIKNGGYAPSMVIQENKIMTGVEFLSLPK